MESVLVGMFDSRDAAEQARTKLLGAGFAATAVTMTGGSGSEEGWSGSSTSTGSSDADTMRSDETRSEGPIARFFDRLFGWDNEDTTRRRDYDDEHAETYREAFRRGSYGVTVTASSDDELDRAEQILNSCGAIDIDERSQTWRNEGWSGDRAPVTGVTGDAGASAGLTGAAVDTMGTAADTGATRDIAGTADQTSDTSARSLTGTTRESRAGAMEGGATRTIPEYEEELRIGKRAIARGGVRIYSRITETPVEESVQLREEHANVQRRTVDRPATAADLDAFKEESIEVREMAEEAVVSKSARVVGEVEVGKDVTEREETVRDTVRKTNVEVENLDPSGRARSGSTERLADDADDRKPI